MTQRPLLLALKVSGLLVAIVMVVVLWFREPILLRMGEWLVAETPLLQADLVVALGGDRIRQDEAVRLLKSGMARWIAFVGSDVRSRDYHCAEVPAERSIPPPGPAYTTYEEALAVRTVMQERGLGSVIIVTSPYHLRRARWTFTEVFRNSGVRVFFVPAPERAFQMNTWWKQHMGRKLVLSEYAALAYYWVAH